MARLLMNVALGGKYHGRGGSSLPDAIAREDPY